MAVEDGASVIFSSHVVSELERVADYAILMARGRLQLVGPIDGILAEHAVLNGPADEAHRVAEHLCLVHADEAARRVQLLVRHDQPIGTPRGGEAGAPSLVGRSGPVAIAATRPGGRAR